MLCISASCYMNIYLRGRETRNFILSILIFFGYTENVPKNITHIPYRTMFWIFFWKNRWFYCIYQSIYIYRGCINWYVCYIGIISKHWTIMVLFYIQILNYNLSQFYLHMFKYKRQKVIEFAKKAEFLVDII